MRKLLPVVLNNIRAFKTHGAKTVISLFGFGVLLFYSVHSDTFRRFNSLSFSAQTIELNSSELNKFINTRYWELKNPSLVPNTRNFDFDQILGISSSNNFKNPYSLWGPRKSLLGNTSKYHTEDDDRLLAQLLLLSDAFTGSRIWNFEKKKILLSSRIHWWIKQNSTPEKLFAGCPSFVHKCELILNGTEASREANISAIILPTHWDESQAHRPIAYSDDVLVFFYSLESNYVSRAHLTKQNDILASYWTGSDIVAPYGKWVYYDPSIRRRPTTGKNYAAGKDKMAAVFVSNCNPFNPRNQYISLLQKHIKVDVYGSKACGGTLSCPRNTADICFQKLKKEYKFYIAFENANCRDYITEKFWLNALSNDVVPIIMGAHPDDFKTAAPEKSYIHVEDFKSTLELSEYLKYLDKHDDEYNKYFEWKGTGELVRGYFLCRVCAMLHYAEIVPPPNRTVELDMSWKSVTGQQLCLPRNRTYWHSNLALE